MENKRHCTYREQTYGVRYSHSMAAGTATATLTVTTITSSNSNKTAIDSEIHLSVLLASVRGALGLERTTSQQQFYPR